jgi:hypothetical protein
MGTGRSMVVSSFTIIKGSMIEETYTVLRDWNYEWTLEVNLQEMKATNAVGARSENWLRDIAFVLHRRVDPGGRDRPLAELAKTHCPMDIWRPILLWHMTRDEFLLRDFLSHWLFPQFTDGTLLLRTEDIHPYLAELQERGVIQEPWKETTTKRVASGLLRMGVDFGLLKGTSVREFQSYHLPEPSFLYLLHAMAEQTPNAHKLVHAEDWRMFLMAPDDVERELFRLHQFRTLRYEVAGSVAQLTLPCQSVAEYVKEMAR